MKPKFQQLYMNVAQYINYTNLSKSLESFPNAYPYDHCIVDDFFATEFAETLANEFIPYDSPSWWNYKNVLEEKKVCSNWTEFPAATYSTFSYLNSLEFLDFLSKKIDIELISDSGLHGGGWHCHGPGGKLNPHLDYNIHPKLGLQRVINIIIYLGNELQEEHGGHLGLWDADENGKPNQLIKEIPPRFNRAVIFNTTQCSWHGISRKLTQPEGIYRKSLAIYYLQTPLPNPDPRNRALFAPIGDQITDPEILEIIRLRSGVSTSSKVYIK